MHTTIKLKSLFALMLAPLLVSSAAAQTNWAPVFQFAVFYNSLLEFTWCGPLTINGWVHANGDIYTGSGWQLTFNSLVSTTGTISSPAWDGHTTSQYTNTPQFSVGYVTNRPPLLLPIATNNTSAAARELINMPPAGEDPNSAVGQQRYYNKAELVLLVSNATVTLTLKSFPTDPAPLSITAIYYPTNSNRTNYVQISTNFPWLNITNTFMDQRESDTVKVTDIDVSVLKRWMFTNAVMNAKFPNSGGVYSISNVPNILYAADNRSFTGSQLTAVRLKNGSYVPTNNVIIAGNTQPSGFTVATPNPLYVQGIYNCGNPAYQGTTNTSASYPASLISDALTILSPNWNDAYSAVALGGSGKSFAASDTVNAAILTGNVPSTGPGASQFSGGVHNLPRLLEDWGSGTSLVLTLNTSLVNLLSSIYATNQYQNPGVYYQAPIRNFNFDQDFLNPSKLPPGTLMLGPVGPNIMYPPLNTTVIAGNSAMFSARAVGFGPLFYQWQFSGTNIPNARGGNLIITNANASDCGVYSVQINNVFGGSASASATLTVLYAPAICWGPASQAALLGSNVTFNVSATGTAPLSYQWQFNGTNLLAGTDTMLLLPCVTDDQAGSYSITVSNVAGMVTSTQAVLSVYDSVAAVLAVPPSSFTDSFQFTITGVPGLNYAIEASTNLVDWIPLATNTSPCTFVDCEATNFPVRYYRSVYLP
jgi:hypothetical protein